MSAMRSRRRSALMSASARASGAPAQLWTPDPKARCWRQFGRSSRSSVGLFEHARIRLAAAGSSITVVPGGISTSPISGADPRQPEGALERGLEPQALLGEPRDQASIAAHLLLELGALAELLEHHAEQARRGLPARREQIRGDQHDVVDLGQRPVGERRVRQLGHHVVARLAPAVLDELREPLVEELQRLVLHLAVGALGRLVVALELLAELLVLVFGNAEQVCDDEEGEGPRVVADELALAPAEELVDLAIGELPHELLVLLETLGRDQPPQQCPVGGVLRGIEGGQLIAEYEPVAVLLDDLADVVALERNRPLGEGPARRRCSSSSVSVSW